MKTSTPTMAEGIERYRLIAFDKTGATLRYKDYRRDGADRQRIGAIDP